MPKKKVASSTKKATKAAPVRRNRGESAPKSSPRVHALAKPELGSGSVRGSGSVVGSGSGSVSGSRGGEHTNQCKFFPKGQLLPVELTLSLDKPLAGGSETGRAQLNRPTLLVHAQHIAFACCWFSQAIDLGDECANPAFWMLQKTAKDEWLLCLRRVSGQLVAYHLTSNNATFSIKLKKGISTKDFKWPSSVTISAEVH